MSSARSLLPSVQPTKPGGQARKVRKGRREVPVGSREDSGNFYIKPLAMVLFAIHCGRSLMRNH